MLVRLVRRALLVFLGPLAPRDRKATLVRPVLPERPARRGRSARQVQQDLRDFLAL